MGTTTSEKGGARASGTGTRSPFVQIQIRFEIHSSKRAEFRQLADRFRSADAGADTGQHAIWESLDDPCTFLWVQRWAESAALEEWWGSDRARALFGAIRILGSLKELRVLAPKPGHEFLEVIPE